MGEDLFKPITKRLDKSLNESEKAEDPAAPNYEMDEFDRLNPFYDEFRPDDETPPPTPPPTPPLPSAEEEEEEESDDDDDDDDEAQETTSRKTWEAPTKTPFPPKTHESTDLGTIKQLITKYGSDTEYRVKSEKSKFRGYSVEDLKRARDEILRRRGELSPLDDASWERETEGRGLVAKDAKKLVKRLYISLGSIKAGNTSTKLRKQVVDLLSLLVKHGMINDFQRNKIYNNYISQ